MDKNVITHAENVEMKSIVTTQMEHASVGAILVISEICAKQVKNQAVFQMAIYTTFIPIRNPLKLM